MVISHFDALLNSYWHNLLSSEEHKGDVLHNLKATLFHTLKVDDHHGLSISRNDKKMHNKSRKTDLKQNVFS